MVEKPEPNRGYTRYGTTPVVSNILIEDETGSMRMSLWNQQIKKVHKGDVINIENGKVIWYHSERHLGLGRSGSLSVIE